MRPHPRLPLLLAVPIVHACADTPQPIAPDAPGPPSARAEAPALPDGAVSGVPRRIPFEASLDIPSGDGLFAELLLRPDGTFEARTPISRWWGAEESGLPGLAVRADRDFCIQGIGPLMIRGTFEPSGSGTGGPITSARGRGTARIAVFAPDPALGTCPGHYVARLPADAVEFEAPAAVRFPDLEAVLILEFGSGTPGLTFLTGRVRGSVIVDLGLGGGADS